MTKAVQFDSYGGIDVLEVRDVPRPVPGAGEVLVEVRQPASIRVRRRSGVAHCTTDGRRRFRPVRAATWRGWWPNSVPASSVSLRAMTSSDFPTYVSRTRCATPGPATPST